MLWIALLAAQVAPFDVKADLGVLARIHCQHEWPDNFEMQAYCLKGQRQGMAEFKAASDAFGKPLEKALEKCAEEWTKLRVPNWEMIGYCAKNQAEAYRSLSR